MICSLEKCVGNRQLWGGLKIASCLFLIVVVCFILSFVHSKEYYIDHFDKIKCNPLYLPFIHWINPSVSTSSNFHQCLTTTLKPFFSILSGPVRQYFQSFSNNIGILGNHANRMKKSTNLLGTSVSTYLQRSYQKYDHTKNVLFYITLKIKAILDKIGVMVMDMYYALISMFDFVNVLLTVPSIVMKIVFGIFIAGIVITVILLIISTVTLASVLSMKIVGTGFLAIPGMQGVGITLLSSSEILRITKLVMYMGAFVGMLTVTSLYGSIALPLRNAYKQADRASYCCFSGNTMVQTDINHYRPFHELRVGDSLVGNNKVVGTLVVYSIQKDWYRYGHQTNVTADHLVYESNHQCVKVKDSIHAYSLDCYENHYRYCLVTTDHHIITPDGNFTDFQEHTTKKLESILHVLKELNQVLYVNPRSINMFYELGEQSIGLLPEQLIKTSSGFKCIKDIQLFDELEDASNIVLGIYHVKLIYSYATLIDENYVCTSQICWHQQYWMKAYQINKHLTIQSNTMAFHLITKKGTFILQNNLMIRDFTEIPNRII